MTYVSWSAKVNARFFSVVRAPLDNFITTEYAGGRKTVILKNTRFVEKISCSLALDVKGGECDAFWKWWKDELGGTAGVFACPALGSGFYRFSAVPSPDSGQLVRRIDMEIEEVY